MIMVAKLSHNSLTNASPSSVSAPAMCRTAASAAAVIAVTIVSILIRPRLPPDILLSNQYSNFSFRVGFFIASPFIRFASSVKSALMRRAFP